MNLGNQPFASLGSSQNQDLAADNMTVVVDFTTDLEADPMEIFVDATNDNLFPG